MKKTELGTGAKLGLIWLACAISAFAQAPSPTLSGQVTDPDGRPVEGALVATTEEETGFTREVFTDSRGTFYVAALPEGTYELRIEAEGYRPVELHGDRLAVGGRYERNFMLEPLSPQPNPPFPRSEPTSAPTIPTPSVVVEEDKILQLPLATRNIYSLFLLEPGVTSQGAIARRGLSFAVHGQRVSASNYLLDGVNNDDIILTGPLAAASAEAVQEFRMVTSSYSAEHGRAAAFVAQVATQRGSNRFHGSIFEYLANDKLNANTFENNSSGEGKSPLRRNQFGFSLSGPVQRNKTFLSGSLEFSRLRHGVPKDLLLPSSEFIASLSENSLARQLLTETPPVAGPSLPDNTDVAEIRYVVPTRTATVLSTVRLDRHLRDGNDRLVARYTRASTDLRSAETFEGYPDLWPEDKFRDHNALLGWTHMINAGQVNDLRVGWSRDRVFLPRPRDEIPYLVSGDDVLLPGSPSTRLLEPRENNNVVQLSNTFSTRRGRSTIAVGFDYRRNYSNGVTEGIQNFARGGEVRSPRGVYYFLGLQDFGKGQPYFFFLGTDRFSAGEAQLPDLYRAYRSNEFSGFVQDDIRFSRRFSLNLGLRYEYFGVPHSADRSRDVNFYFGAGDTIEERLENGELRSTDQNPGDLQGRLYRRDPTNFSPSVGLVWDVWGNGKSLVRAGYALVHDRVFDTIRDLRTNHSQLVMASPALWPQSFVLPVEATLPLLEESTLWVGKSVVQLDENLATPYAQNWHARIQQTITTNFMVEVAHVGSVGRKLIGRDVINRSIGYGPPLNREIHDSDFLSNTGNSNYLALEVSLRRRFSQGLQYQVSYTYSHAIDNQSDILEGVRTGPGPLDAALATFTRQFDARVDRGNANFDQRHNLVFNAVYSLPEPRWMGLWPRLVLGGWTASVIGGYRSGFPVTVISLLNDPTSGLRNVRMDYVGSGKESPHTPVPGGMQWLNPADFSLAEGGVGSLGRGSLRGPGFWNYDFAILKDFGSSEAQARVQFRAEFYNIFNHANLSTPNTLYLDQMTGQVNPNFGEAYYGLNRSYSRFGDLPLASPSREIQLALRIQF